MGGKHSQGNEGQLTDSEWLDQEYKKGSRPGDIMKKSKKRVTSSKDERTAVDSKPEKGQIFRGSFSGRTIKENPH
jgi:hypothetical protein